MSNSMIGNTNDLKYIGTFEGKFVMRVSEGTEGAQSRVNKLGNTVHEIRFNKLTGQLVDIIEKDGDYGKRYQFVFSNKGDKAALESSLKGNLASAIINRLPNLDLSSPFEIVSRYNNEKGSAYFFINQDGEEVKDYFQTWDSDTKKWTLHHKFPAWEKIIVDGEEKWDSTKQIAYQKKVVAKYLPELQVNDVAESIPEPPVMEEEEEEDLPF